MSAEPAPADVVVLGSVNMDLVATVGRRAAPGETVLGTGFAAVPGGKGANQAVAARRGGAVVRFLGAVGDDVFAPALRESLVREGIDVRGLRTAAGPSGTATIVVDGDGENSIVVVPAANHARTELDPDDLAAIAAADILLCQLELPVPVVAAGFTHARANRTVTVLNPSPVQRLPAELWELVDIAVLNRGEAEAIGDVLDQVPHRVTTLGADGARYDGPDGCFTVPAVPVRAVDTTGAGDAFTGALAARWAHGPEAALRWACAAGALATTALGATTAVPDAATIAGLLAGRAPQPG
ncbi:ribokinase [Nocardia asteroides]|uniref:ribokinase n=1 Tax=Nocardia asteroides TaxID=1824 RepID=UPI0022B8115B|nr:ribokinase [Nocardia asteroides]